MAPQDNSTPPDTPEEGAHHDVLIVGGGTAGLTCAARLRKSAPQLDVAVIDPSEKHYYQPIWTLVGGGVFPREISERPQADAMPKGVRWIQDRVDRFDPENDRVELADGGVVSYDQLIVAAGIQLNWDGIPGLQKTLGRDGVCSNYSYDHVEKTWEFIRNVQPGQTLVFTHPSTPIKCGGAPQKIMYLAADHLRKQGILEDVKIVFAIATPTIFSVKEYADTLCEVADRYGIEVRYGHDLSGIRPGSKEAVFKTAEGAEVVEQYDLLHVTPPMSAPDFIRESPLAADTGWVDVDKETLQHVRYPSVFSLGDCSNLPTSKTGAAVRKQAPALVANLLALRAGTPLAAKYDGYTSCPLVTGYGKLVLAEFGYDLKPDETFPFDQNKERWSMYMLKAHALPQLYWHGMLRGRA